MRERIHAWLLALSLGASGDATPPEWFFDWVGGLPRESLEAWRDGLEARGLYFPAVEVIDFTRAHPTGVYWVIWNRAKDHPLDYPFDWVVGRKRP